MKVSEVFNIGNVNDRCLANWIEIGSLRLYWLLRVFENLFE